MTRLFCLIALAALLIAPIAVADTQKPVSDAEFVQMASSAGLAEVNMARLAQEHASRDDVKAFAKRIVEEHTKANMELNRIADAKRMAPAATMDAKHQDLIRQMSRLSGSDFDNQFIQTQLKAHENAVALFENQSKNGKDEQLKAFAAKTLPTLREHLDQIRKLAGAQGTRPGTGVNRQK